MSNLQLNLFSDVAGLTEKNYNKQKMSELFRKKSVYDSLSERERDAVDIFCGVLGNYSGSTQMITTWLGREQEEGGKIIIGWNTLIKLMWECIAVSKGIKELPPEIRKYLDEYQDYAKGIT